MTLPIPAARLDDQEEPDSVPYADGPIWNWFGLTYSSYVVFPRRAACSMPLEWQERFVTLMEEASERLPDEAIVSEYYVRRREGGKFVEDPNVPYKHAEPWPLKPKASRA